MKIIFAMLAVFAATTLCRAQGTNAVGAASMTNTNGWQFVMNAAPQSKFTVCARNLQDGTLSPVIVQGGGDDEMGCKHICAYQMKKNRTPGIEWVVVCPNGDIWRKSPAQ